MSKFFSSLMAASCCALFVSGCSSSQTTKPAPSESIPEVSFDESMGKSASEFRVIFNNADDTARYEKSRALYEKNLPSKVAASKTPKIPKIIHQIWVGPKLPPPYFAEFQEKILRLHPGWEYHLWSEAELEELHLDNWDLVKKSTNYAEMSDIIRADLLDRFGGVYLDIDIDVLRPLDELHEKYDFYAGMEHPHKIATTPNHVWVGISIMASRPGHPIMKNWKRRVRNGWDEVDIRFSSQVERVINHTYFNFTHAVMQEMDQPGNTDILFPATYFYPIAPNYAAKRRSSIRVWRERLYAMLERFHLKRPRAFSRSYPETIAVHYWGNQWLPTMECQMKELLRLVDMERKEQYKLRQKVRQLEQALSQCEQRLASHEEKFSALSSALTERKTHEDIQGETQGATAS